MVSTRLVGLVAETDAVGFLNRHGYRILARNYSVQKNLHGGEIDIIARLGERIHFIEVKARNSNRFGLGREAVTMQKQKTIRALATRWLQRHDLIDKVDVQFDVIEITNGKVEFIQNCF